MYVTLTALRSLLLLRRILPQLIIPFQERKLTTRLKKRQDKEKKSTAKIFQELKNEMKAQFDQVSTLESQIQALEEQAEKTRLVNEQKEKEMQDALKLAEDEAVALNELEKATSNRNDERAPGDLDSERQYIAIKEEFQRARDDWHKEREERTERIEELIALLEHANEELEQMEAERKENQEAVRMADKRAAEADRMLQQASTEWTARHSEQEKLRGEERAISAQLRTQLQELEGQMVQAEVVALERGREEGT